MSYYFLILLIFISLLFKGSLDYYALYKIDLYLFLIPIIIFKILLNFRKNKIGISKPIIYFFLYLFSIFFSLLINNSYENNNNLDFFTSLKSVFSYLIWPLIFLLSATEKISKKESIRINKLIWGMGYVIAANTLIPVVIYFLTGNFIGEFILDKGGIRSFGFLTDQVGFALVYFILLSLYNKKYLSTLFFFISILVTGTRGAIALSLIALVLMFIYQKEAFSFTNKFILFRRGFLILLILIIAWKSLGDKLTNVLAFRIDNESIENVFIQRFGAMEAGLTLFSQNPFFGVGVGKFSELVYNNIELSKDFLYSDKFTKAENMRGYANAQNEFINILVNGGVFSMIFIVLFITSILKNIKRKISAMVQPGHQIVAFFYLVLSILFIQTSLYMFNQGIVSFIILILMGRGSSKSLY